MITFSEIIDKIKSAEKIAIFAHKNPDPDAYGSMFSLRYICQYFGKSADVFAIKNLPNYLNFIYPLDEVKSDFVAENYDLVILVDMHVVSRLAKEFIDEFEKCKNIMIIDHHAVVEGEILPSDNLLLNSKSAATCELLTDMIKMMKIEITPTVATYLYAGLMGDTDRFLHNNLTHNVFETALYLMDRQANIQHVYDYLFRYRTPEQMEIYKFILNTIQYHENGQACSVIFRLEDLEKLHADHEDVKVFVNDLVNLKGVVLSVFCMEYEKDFYKMSLRSCEGINTREFSAQHGGGGHIGASGFEKTICYEDLKQELPKWCKEILNSERSQI